MLLEPVEYPVHMATAPDMDRLDTPLLLVLPAQEGERPKVNFGDTTSGSAPAGSGAPVEAAAGTVQEDGAALGGGAGEEPAGGGGLSFWLMLALLFGFMWFFVIRPENKRQKKRKEFQTALAKGDDVVTAGGLHGVIAAIDEQTITLKVADGVRLKFDRVAVSRNASAKAEEDPAQKK